MYIYIYIGLHERKLRGAQQSFFNNYRKKILLPSPSRKEENKGTQGFNPRKVNAGAAARAAILMHSLFSLSSPPPALTYKAICTRARAVLKIDLRAGQKHTGEESKRSGIVREKQVVVVVVCSRVIYSRAAGKTSLRVPAAR